MSVADSKNRRTACHGEVSCPPILFNIYTNDQSLHNGTHSFIYADDMCTTAQQPSFVEVETTIEESLSELTQYYRSNNLRANPDKTQVTAFYLRNKEAKKTLTVKWNRTYLDNTPNPKYLGVTLDRTLSYKQHIHNTKMKVAARNISLESCPALSGEPTQVQSEQQHWHYSVAEYAAPVWARSAHAYKLDSDLNSACPAITECLKPTNVEELYFLSGIAPPSIRRDVCARVEKAKQETNEAHFLQEMAILRWRHNM